MAIRRPRSLQEWHANETSDAHQAPVLETRDTSGAALVAYPTIAASGTVGSVVEMAGVADLKAYGAAVAKASVPSPERAAFPRVAPAGVGMLNGIGIQNPGIDRWRNDFGRCCRNCRCRSGARQSGTR